MDKCKIRDHGDVERYCKTCGYVTWRDDSKTDTEIQDDMALSGYPLPNCRVK